MFNVDQELRKLQHGQHAAAPSRASVTFNLDEELVKIERRHASETPAEARKSWKEASTEDVRAELMRLGVFCH